MYTIKWNNIYSTLNFRNFKCNSSVTQVAASSGISDILLEGDYGILTAFKYVNNSYD